MSEDHTINSEAKTDHGFFRQAKKSFSGILLFSTSAILGANILSAAIFPVIENILKDVIKAQATNLPFVTGANISLYIIYTIHVIFGAYSIIGLFKIKDFLKVAQIDEIEQGVFTLENELIEEKIRSDTLRLQRGTSVKRQIAILGSLSVLRTLLNTDIIREPREGDVESILAPLVKDRADTLRFTSTDFHNFAVYTYNKENENLQIFYRICDDRIERHDRSWKVGEGHVGIAFAQKRSIITSDVAKNNELREVLQKHYSEKDEKFYTSFISAPFVVVDNDKEEQYGVLVITSSRSNHFNEDERLLAVSYSGILSLYFSSCHRRGKNEQEK